MRPWSGWQQLEIVHPATTTFHVSFIGETDEGSLVAELAIVPVGHGVVAFLRCGVVGCELSAQGDRAKADLAGDLRELRKLDLSGSSYFAGLSFSF